MLNFIVFCVAFSAPVAPVAYVMGQSVAGSLLITLIALLPGAAIYAMVKCLQRPDGIDAEMASTSSCGKAPSSASFSASPESGLCSSAGQACRALSLLLHGSSILLLPLQAPDTEKPCRYIEVVKDG